MSRASKEYIGVQFKTSSIERGLDVASYRDHSHVSAVVFNMLHGRKTKRGVKTWRIFITLMDFQRPLLIMGDKTF